MTTSPRIPAPRSPQSAADRVAYVIAVWFGCGLVPRAPGTAGTLGAIPLYLALRPLGPGAIALAFGLITLIGIWASERVVRQVGRPDPQIVCVDEVAGVLLAWVPAPETFSGLAAGFVLFRLFDHLKPWPANLAERRARGGMGVVLDDVAAGAWAALLIAGARWLGLL